MDRCGFRAYADYADTPEFAAALDDLLLLAKSITVAIMCAEGLWWQCHRRIISGQLTVAGWFVRHILPDGKCVAHALRDFARIDDRWIVYDTG